MQEEEEVPATLAIRPKPKMEKQKPTFADALSVVTFVIGPGPDPMAKIEEFVVHKEFVRYYSSVLDAAFNGRFVEGQTQTYRMDDVSAGAFRGFVQWLYSQKLDLTEMTAIYEIEVKDRKAEFNTGIMYLAEIWVLAGKLLIPLLQNASIKAILDVGHNMLAAPVATLNYIYERTNDSQNPLRRVAVHLSMQFEDAECLEKTREILPKEFLLELSCTWQRDFVGPFMGTGHVSTVVFPHTEVCEFFVDIEGVIEDGHWVSAWPPDDEIC